MNELGEAMDLGQKNEDGPLRADAEDLTQLDRLERKENVRDKQQQVFDLIRWRDQRENRYSAAKQIRLLWYSLVDRQEDVIVGAFGRPQ